MAHRLTPVHLEFADSAPLRLVFTAEVRARPDAVYRALAEDVTDWPEWFRAVASARPTGRGTGREVRLRGGTRFQETIMSAEPGERYAYRIDETNAPGVRAMVEDWRLSPTSSGTRVQWTMAVAGSAPVRFALKLARPGVGRAFEDAVRRLDRRLAGASA
ncbi:SRPBCC family protein [Streptomyces sp. NPDC059176]|uniref:SRPBCC family protein n=1 Tax=unclassified Streptomyces TaxID=2593676 RepID=UPI0036AF4424